MPTVNIYNGKQNFEDVEHLAPFIEMAKFRYVPKFQVPLDVQSKSQAAVSEYVRDVKAYLSMAFPDVKAYLVRTAHSLGWSPQSEDDERWSINYHGIDVIGKHQFEYSTVPGEPDLKDVVFSYAIEIKLPHERYE